jgi:hypothetical protein
MTKEKKNYPAILFFYDRGEWHRTVSLSTALKKSGDVVVTWDRGKESIFYLDKERGDRSYALHDQKS